MPNSSASNLSNAVYGFDFVVAVTQAGINATMKSFLDSLTEPLVNICYTADKKGNPLLTPYEDVLKSANGSDPFEVPDGATPDTNSDLVNLDNARFIAGFRARIGLPAASDVSKIPDIVTLGSDTSAVKFNMLCSDFIIVSNGMSKFDNTWVRKVQDPNAPWVFSAMVDLRLENTNQTAFGTLPAEVQAQIKNLGDAAFSVQQLLFDLSSAGLQHAPDITNVPEGTPAHTLLTQYFVDAYFGEMQKEHKVLLGCAVVDQNAPSSSLQMTDFTFGVNPFMNEGGQPVGNATTDELQLATLDYLCAAGNPLPTKYTKFPWNWVDGSELSDHIGVLSINRNSLARYFEVGLQSQVAECCLEPSVRVWLSGLYVNFQCGMTPGQNATVVKPATGKTVLSYAYSGYSSDQAGLNGDSGQMSLKTSYSATMDFEGSTITITQQMTIHLYAWTGPGTSDEGNIVDKKIVDTYSIGVDANGHLQATMTSTPTDKSQTLTNSSVWEKIWGNSDALSSSIQRYSQGFVSTSFADVPLDIFRNYVFPGGKTFVFKHASFSDFQDLVAFINYADPLAPAAKVPVKGAHVPKPLRGTIPRLFHHPPQTIMNVLCVLPIAERTMSEQAAMTHPNSFAFDNFVVWPSSEPPDSLADYTTGTATDRLSSGSPPSTDADVGVALASQSTALRDRGQLPFVQLTDWHEDLAYDEHPPTCGEGER
ncbi:hypothetical protein B0T25DRAFT_632340 [Lasiosphaeria hispida]|uniref:Uncharacterized protein n=1 Tax=Lasiosphaeria hispida TaxID=260671 RepID=A0AAJ0HK73_9PEZI|nr:hypothetical protein B0T25DRAFT_632340 [Lasiosphaeria hispida]